MAKTGIRNRVANETMYIGIQKVAAQKRVTAFGEDSLTHSEPKKKNPVSIQPEK